MIKTIKKDELVEKVKKISNHLKKEKLIDVAYKVVEDYGKGRITPHSFHTHHHFKLETNKFKIELDDKYNQMGSGDLNIFYENKLVLELRRSYFEKDSTNSIVENWEVVKYYKGMWEKEIKNLPKKMEEKNKR
ncbi:hypothetical protein GW931_00195 [archaeon]|nr:hypothetical protein [archaeon]PJC45577.1 MAG: hypothetical protein CO037_00805 [Candidatus Pacearchaeota archaeon CG_4_9_14_0_2_um_filter_30_8]